MPATRILPWHEWQTAPTYYLDLDGTKIQRTAAGMLILTLPNGRTVTLASQMPIDVSIRLPAKKK